VAFRPDLRLFGALLTLALAASEAIAQPRPGTAAAPAAEPAAASTRDALGRDTPRGTVIGFLTAARKDDNELARHYLNTPESGAAAERLAHQLFVVLDTRLPARLTQVNDTPEGSRANPLEPDQEVVGTIEGPSGNLAVIVERVKQPRADPIWLFSATTLQAIPAAFEDIAPQVAAPRLPDFLTERSIAGIRLFEWLAVLLGLPAFYFLTGLVNRLLTPAVAWVGQRTFTKGRTPVRSALPLPARLLLLSVAGRWLFSQLPLSLLVRQFLSHASAVTGICAVVWLLILITGVLEGAASRRIPRANFSAAASLLHVGRRIVDVVVVLAGVFGILRHFGVDPTPVLAGLGVGGIAFALAAQKTLENVIAGASLIFDQAVRAGDSLRIGAIEGTVEHIGLRSTRIRTLDRTIVCVPNSQIANMSLETLSVRDKFWFHPVVALRHETTSDQLHQVLDGIRQLLTHDTHIDGGSVRVRFQKLGAISLDVEVFAYVVARDWGHFMEIQERLLFGITGIVADAGTALAFPFPTPSAPRATEAVTG
jgi:MscS family membrane protein